MAKKRYPTTKKSRRISVPIGLRLYQELRRAADYSTPPTTVPKLAQWIISNYFDENGKNVGGKEC